MEAVKRILKFGIGGAFGALVGAGIAGMLAPQKGEQLQANTREFVANVKSEGETARASTERRLAEKYRTQVDDQTALTGTTTHQAPKSA